MALEDRRFWWHPGIDPIAMVRAFWQNVSSGARVSGASTLAMQVARMQHPDSRSIWAKLSAEIRSGAGFAFESVLGGEFLAISTVDSAPEQAPQTRPCGAYPSVASIEIVG